MELFWKILRKWQTKFCPTRTDWTERPQAIMTTSRGRSIALYHGTGQFYTGPPTLGYKCLLKTGYPSMTNDPMVAEFFTDGSRDGRIYRLEVPLDKILNVTEQARKLSRRKQWSKIGDLVLDGAETGRYWAVAITDITFGNDEPEFRLVGTPPDDAWTVRPSQQQLEYYREHNDVIRRFKSGQPLGHIERMEAILTLQEAMDMDRDSADTLLVMADELGLEPDRHLPKLNERMAADRELLTALEINSPALLTAAV